MVMDCSWVDVMSAQSKIERLEFGKGKGVEEMKGKRRNRKVNVKYEWETLQLLPRVEIHGVVNDGLLISLTPRL